MSQGGNPPQPRSGMRPATAGGAARPRVGPAQLRLQGCGKRPLGCKESGEVSAQCGLLKLSFLVTNKEREMFVSKRGWERAEPAGFCRKDGCSEVGMWCSAPGPAATTDFICSLACITRGDTIFQGTQVIAKQTDSGASQLLLPHFPWQLPMTPTALTAPAKSFRGS